MNEAIDNLALEIKEYGYVAAGRLSEVISQLTQKEMSISVPKSTVLKISDASDLVGGKSIIAGYTGVYGDCFGSLIFLIGKKDAINLVELLLNDKIDTSLFPASREKTVLKELCTITADSFLLPISQFTSCSLKSKSPIVAAFGAFNLLNFLNNVNETREDYEKRDIVWISIGYNVQGTEAKGEILTLVGPNVLDYLTKELNAPPEVATPEAAAPEVPPSEVVSPEVTAPKVHTKPSPKTINKTLILPQGEKVATHNIVNLITLENALKKESFTGYLKVELMDRFEKNGVGEILFISGDIIAASYEIDSRVLFKSEALEEMFNIPYTNVEVFSYDDTDIWLAIERNKSQLFEYKPPEIKKVASEATSESKTSAKEVGAQPSDGQDESTFSVIFDKNDKNLTRDDLLSKYRIRELSEEDADSLISSVMDD